MDTNKVSAQIDKLRDETMRLTNRPQWVPVAQAVLLFAAILVVTRGLIAIL